MSKIFEWALPNLPAVIGVLSVLVAIIVLVRTRKRDRIKDHNEADAILFEIESQIAEKTKKAMMGSSGAGLSQSEFDVFNEKIKKAMRIDNKYARAHHAAGSMYAAAGQMTLSTSHYRKAIEIEPDNHENYVGLIVTMYRTGQMDETTRLAKIAINKAKKTPDTAYSLGMVLNTLGVDDLTKEFYLELLKLNPPNSAFWYNYASFLTKAQRFVEANQALERAAKINPSDAQIFLNLGNARMRVGNIHQAVESYNHAIYLDPKYALPYRNLAAAYAQLGKQDMANKAIQKYTELGGEL